MMNERFKTNVPGADQLPGLEALLDAVRTAGMEQYLAAMLGVEELKASDEPAQLVSLCAGVEYLARKTGDDALAAAGEQAAAMRQRWMDASFAAVDRRVNFLRSLVKAAGLESQSAFLERYRIFMDGSILCAEGISQFLDRLLPAMTIMENAGKITVPHCVVKQMEGLMNNDLTMELSGARDGMVQLQRIQKVNLLSIRGDENDTTTMSTFISAFSRFKPSNNLVLLTEDPMLAGAVGMLNSIGIEGDDILVATLSADGVARVWGEPEEQIAAAQEPATEPEPAAQEPAAEENAAQVHGEAVSGADYVVIGFEEPLDGGAAAEAVDFLAPAAMDEPLDGNAVEEIADFLAAAAMDEPLDGNAVEEIADFLAAAAMDEPLDGNAVEEIADFPAAAAMDEPLDGNAVEEIADFPAVAPMDEPLGGTAAEAVDFLTPVPMDEPLDVGNAWEPQEKLPELDEDDEDDEDDIGEEKLEKYLQISGLLQLSDDDESGDDEFFLSEDEDDDLEEEIVFLEEEDSFDEDMILLEDVEQFDEDAEDDVELPLEQDEELPSEQAPVEQTLRTTEQIGSLEELDELQELDDLEGIDGFEVSVSELEWEPLD